MNCHSGEFKLGLVVTVGDIVYAVYFFTLTIFAYTASTARPSLRPPTTRHHRKVRIPHMETLKGKGSPYSITERRVPELIQFLAVSLQVT